jgi:hypothetical protein
MNAKTLHSLDRQFHTLKISELDGNVGEFNDSRDTSSAVIVIFYRLKWLHFNS